ncbi:MAG: ligand-gated channel protein [Rhizobiales bacterium 62-17]|nr:TonB-dependent siderophore receptor [Hyphomicrobiales bacterium]OJY04381.1 MAG: ligand-gated channel protein [Rhizobiales bacterium 62-17]
MSDIQRAALGALAAKDSIKLAKPLDLSTCAMTTAVLLAVAPFETAMAQPAAGLPPVTVDAPQQRARPAAARPTPRAARNTASQPRRAQRATAAAPRPVPAAGPSAQLPTFVQGAIGSGPYNTQFASSPRQTAPLLNTPQTVSVIPNAVIREQGARTLTEVLRNTPGISFDAGENGFSTSTNNFKLRGFDSSGSIYVDGARDNGSYTRDTFNVERVEVFKGSAADNGRGGLSGYVNIVTKTPQLMNFSSGEIGLGFDQYNSKARKRASVDANYVIAPTTALRVNGFVEDSGVPGRSIAENKAWGIAPSITWGLGTDLRATLSYEHVTRDDVPDWGVPGASIKGMVNYNPVAGSARRSNFYGLRSDVDKVQSDAITARLEYDLGNSMTLSNQLRWSRVDRFARYTVPTAYVPGTQTVTAQTQFYDRTVTTLSNNTNLSGRFNTGWLTHNFSVGIDLTREESEALRYGTGAVPATSVFFPNPDRAFAPVLAPTERNKVEINSVAGYAYNTIELGPRWSITGGLRAEQYNAKISSKGMTGLPAGAFDGYSDSHFLLNGKLGVVYKPTPDGTFYASVGVATLPPGAFMSNPDISRTGDNAFPGLVAGAKPVQALNYEVGIKWDFFDKRLSATAALFRIEKHNAAITGRDIGETTTTLKGYGRQVVQGAEFSVAGKITDAWNVFGGLAIINSERLHSAYLDSVRRRADPGDYGTRISTSGDELAFTPNVTANLWTTYRFPIGLTVGGGFQYVGSSYLGRPDDALRIIPNGNFGRLPAYTVVHAMAAYEITKDITLRLNVDNIFDEKYAVSSNWNGTRAALGVPRTFRASLAFRF